jgi:hypothetical protein
VLYYFDLTSTIVKTATHARFDEGMNDLHLDAPRMFLHSATCPLTELSPPIVPCFPL